MLKRLMRTSYGPAVILALLMLGGKSDGQPIQAAEYVVGPEDVLTVTVLKHPEFSGDFLVSTSGRIDVPGTGEIQAAGKTLAEIKQAVTSVLGKTHLKKPDVSVSLKEARFQRVYVTGDVKLAGVVDLKPGWGIPQALAAAGGLTPELQQADVTVTVQDAEGSLLHSLTLSDALNKQGDELIRLRSGDTVRFEGIKLISVYVSGRVKNPGIYRLRSDSPTVLGAIAVAGGVSDDASLHVQIMHVDGQKEAFDLVPSLVKGVSATSPKLSPGDMILVSQNQNRFVILGYITRPGSFPIPDGQQFKLSEAIALGQGEGQIDRKPKLSKVALIRGEGTIQKRYLYNFSRFLSKGDASQNPIIQPGDIIFVPQTDHVDFSTVLQAISSATVIYYYTK